jgi:predicted signal transduction protein with EAL and GGDEF domain
MRSILKLSETLHLETVAEGIEDVGQLTQLQALGAAQGQGFLLGRPLTAIDVSARLAAGGSWLDSEMPSGVSPRALDRARAPARRMSTDAMGPRAP